MTLTKMRHGKEMNYQDQQAKKKSILALRGLLEPV